jgi:hypothetical protein
MSCELIVDVDVPYEGDKIVVNGIQRTGIPWTVELSRSVYILDNAYKDGFPWITQADVTVYGDDGTQITLEHDTLGYFTHPSLPVEGRKYTIVAKANGLPDVQAEMVMPRSVKIKDAKWDSTGVSNDPNAYFANLRLDLTFDDPADQVNYYSVIVGLNYSITYQRPTDPAPVTDTAVSYYEAYILDPAISTDEERRVRRFSDATFNGKTYTAPLSVQFYASPGYKMIKVDLELTTISDECYKYDESRSLYNETEGDPFAQPVQIYSNVQNGFGVFGGNSIDTRSYKRKQ